MEKPFNMDSDLRPRRLMLLLIIFAFLLFYLLYQLLPPARFDILTENFNRIAVGLSALAAVIFGPSLVGSELEKDRKIKEYIDKYPYDKFGTEWDLIQSKKYLGAIYLLDKKLKTKHHILNMKTVYDLGWHIYWHKIKTLEDNVFQNYKVGERIRTQGEAGE